MRPTRLELEGFISFRERIEIDFSSLDLFGITGPTGAGKTALIDSMIFALYGKTPRLGEKVTQELISQGAPQLRVLLEFLCGDVEYRVLRIVKRKGAGRTQIEHKRDGEWHPIAGSTRELRERVEEIIGLDFDGFTKTVVLPQGQFDRFLRGDGAARRKILSDLLGLDTYEQMMKRANEIARDASRQSDVLTELAEQQFASATPERLAELDTEIAAAARERDAAAHSVAQLEKTLPLVLQLRHTEAEVTRYRGERDRVRKSLEAAAALVAEARLRIEKNRRELEAAGYDAQRHLEVAAMLPIARRQAELRGSIAALAEREKKEAAEESRLVKAAGAARTEHHDIVARLKETARTTQAALDEWEEFRKKHGSADLIDSAARDALQYANISAAIASLHHQAEAAAEALVIATQASAALIDREKHATDGIAVARNELDRLRLRHAAAGVRQLLQQGEPCPVCLHPVGQLPDSDKEHSSLSAAEKTLRAAEAERELWRAKVVSNRAEIESLRKKVELDSQRLEQSKQSLAALEAVAKRVIGKATVGDPSTILNELSAKAKSMEASATQSEKLLRAATATESTLRQKLSEAETRLALARQARENTARELEAKQAEWNTAAPQEWDLQSVEGEAAALKKARELHERLAEQQAQAERAVSKAEVDERSLSERLSLADANLVMVSDRLENVRIQLEGLPYDEKIEARLTDARGELQQLELRLNTARIGRQGLATQAREAEELARRVAGLDKECAVYSKLGTMLRTDQFVAWILKDAFARLAYEGSRQLEGLSNGRYTFAAGGDDFAVCDRWNAGERRSVHTLSGGESFLASLSLALALSRGLPEFAANRDRFHLDSLFLDEGFSTLDAETLDTVLGAVEMLQADCRLIGVISHATELAERLPGRIEVVKGANGSRLVVR